MADEAVLLDPSELKKLKVVQLKSLLSSYGLPISGLKAELIGRLHNYALQTQASAAADGNEANGSEQSLSDVKPDIEELQQQSLPGHGIIEEEETKHLQEQPLEEIKPSEPEIPQSQETVSNLVNPPHEEPEIRVVPQEMKQEHTSEEPEKQQQLEHLTAVAPEIVKDEENADQQQDMETEQREMDLSTESEQQKPQQTAVPPNLRQDVSPSRSMPQSHHMKSPPPLVQDPMRSPPQVPHLMKSPSPGVPQPMISSPPGVPHPMISSPPAVPHPMVSSPPGVPQPVMSPPPGIPQPMISSPPGVPQSMTSPTGAPQPMASSPPGVQHSMVSSPKVPSPMTSPSAVPQPMTSPGIPHSMMSPPSGVSQSMTSPTGVPHPNVSSPKVPSPMNSPPPMPQRMTSPGVTHPMTSPKVSSPMTSPPKVPQPMTSPGVPHPMTPPGVPHPMTSPPGVPHPVTSPPGVPRLVTSPEVPHPMTSPPGVPHGMMSSPQRSPHPLMSPQRVPRPMPSPPPMMKPSMSSPPPAASPLMQQSVTPPRHLTPPPRHQPPPAPPQIPAPVHQADQGLSPTPPRHDSRPLQEPPEQSMVTEETVVNNVPDDQPAQALTEPGTQEDETKGKKRRKKKKKKKRSQRQREEVTEVMDDEDDVEIEYVPEQLGIDHSDPNYAAFSKIFEAFKLTDIKDSREERKSDKQEESALSRKIEVKDHTVEEDEDEGSDVEEEKKEEDDKPKLSKKKLRKMNRLSVAELKQLVQRPDVVEMHDVTALDPKLLVYLKAYRNTVPVPRHWCFKRKYLQGKRGVEKPPFDLPEFIKKTGVMEMRAAMQEKEDQKTLKSKMREKVRPKMGKIDIDYQKLHDAFFKWQTKPKMTIHGDLYYEGKEYETKLKEKKPGDLSDDLRTALGMPTGPNKQLVPPPWLIAMQRYGPPPSYPNLKIPGLNAPIPEGASFGYHAGGWGKPPVDQMGQPLYGDVFGMQQEVISVVEEEDQLDRAPWGELESESESEEEESESEEEGVDQTGLMTPAETGLITPSGLSSVPAGMETPDMIELRKRKTIEEEMEMGDQPSLYTVIPEKKTSVGGAMMGSAHIYDITQVQGGPPRKALGDGVEVALDPSELELDPAAMQARYDQQMRERENQLQKEDLSDMVAEHAAKQKKRKKATDSGKATKKYKEFKF